MIIYDANEFLKEKIINNELKCKLDNIKNELKDNIQSQATMARNFLHSHGTSIKSTARFDEKIIDNEETKIGKHLSII